MVQVCRKRRNVDDELVGELKGTVGRILARSKDGCTSDPLLFSLTGATCMATIPEELMGDIIPGGPILRVSRSGLRPLSGQANIFKQMSFEIDYRPSERMSLFFAPSCRSHGIDD